MASGMRRFDRRCPEEDDTYVQVTRLACAQAHLVNPKTGKVLGSDDE